MIDWLSLLIIGIIVFAIGYIIRRVVAEAVIKTLGYAVEIIGVVLIVVSFILLIVSLVA